MSIDYHSSSLRLSCMSVSKPQSLVFLLLLCLIALDADCFGRALAADSLDDYLKHLGYEGIAFKNSESDKPVIQGVLNGKKRDFLVDTGWGITSLDQPSARACKTPAEMGVALEDSYLGTITNSAVVIMEKLVLGRAQFLNQPARVRPLQMDFIAVGYDGILGCDFFHRNFCLVDCAGKKLFVRAAMPSNEQADALAQTLNQSGFGKVQLRQHGILALKALINEQPILLGVDTGYFVSALDESLIKPLGLSIVKQGATGTLLKDDLDAKIIGVGKIGAHKLRVTTLKRLQIGPRIWQEVHVGVANLKDWGIGELGTPAEDLQGLLGAELLATHGALIDFASNTLWFRPEKKKH